MPKLAIGNLFLNPTTCCFCLNVTKYQQCFVPKPNQSSVDLVRHDAKGTVSVRVGCDELG